MQPLGWMGHVLVELQLGLTIDRLVDHVMTAVPLQGQTTQIPGERDPS